MSAWTATTLALAITAATAVAADGGPCGPKSPPSCADNAKNIDFNSVPDITKKIVGEEPLVEKKNKPLNEPAPAVPYTGPIFGATSGATSGKKIPTVGYSWSLE
ncbi:MAG: hypothetical protein JO320_25015 [Alphaproteobacteria bacterium]|nr:hypothetical protein [Alphaproteobacteria bacterium]